MTTTLKQKTTCAELKTLLDNVFDPKGSEMQLFLEALAENPQLAKFFFRVPRVESDGTKKTRTGGATKVVGETDMCTAMTWGLVKNEEGDLIPKRCSKAKKGDGLYCTQHGSKIPEEKQKCKECTLRDCSKVIHEFKWEHLGTIDEPAPMFETHRQDLERIYNKSQGIEIPSKPRGKKSKMVDSDSEQAKSDSESDKEETNTDAESENQVEQKKVEKKKVEKKKVEKKKVEEEEEEEEETSSYNYNEEHNVFVDSITKVAYANKGSVDEPEVDDENAVGQYKSNGVLSFFKKK
jgi:hypothetical protein